jgi:hypothetical protein
VGRKKASGRCGYEMHTEIARHNEDVNLKSFSEHRPGVSMESGSTGKFSLKMINQLEIIVACFPSS